MISTEDRLRSFSFAAFVLGVVIAVIGIPLSILVGRGYGAPNFWVGIFFVSLAWIAERRARRG